MSEVKNYQNINDFLRDIQMPSLVYPEFYIVKFEDYNPNPDPNSTGPYMHDYFEVSLSIGYDVEVSIIDKKINAVDYNLSFVSPRQIVTWDLNMVKKNTISYMILFKAEFLPFANDVFSIYENFPFFNNNTLSSFELTHNQRQLF